jgi:radial spoke head protein 9
VSKQDVPPIERAKLNKALDFMDDLESDTPKGVWSLKNEDAGQAVRLFNWLWPGFTFYHRPGTSSFGSVYNGTGLRNADIAFML